MPSLPDIIYLSTRASPLAVAQAEMVRDALLHAHPTIEPDRIQLLTMTTTGDQIQDRTLMEAGGKGLFTKEIEDALIDGRASLAIHSMKDVPTELPPGLVIDCLLPRAGRDRQQRGRSPPPRPAAICAGGSGHCRGTG